MVAGVRLRYGVATDQAARETNEDTASASDGLFLVADGMGGHEAGEVASRVAVDVVARLAGTTPTMDDVTRVVREAHSAVRELPAEGQRRPGTTLTGVVVTEHAGVPCWLVLNVGDSRTYRMAGGMLEQVTQDHSEVAELVEQGLVAVEDAARHPRRHVVTRVLGGAASRVDPDLRMFPVSPGDRMVMCSDGLTEALSDARVQAVLRTERHPRAAADRLVREALAAGAQDNVTVVVVDAVAVTREPGAATGADVAR
ncbi:PP2C family protein-serine/threonine phosphatase [Cellulomonas dongxiuzhuiae]|uniref:Protein phosphatase 2C domain-containing protein n=1 Tax=Cellulomonas dongxiuzhuiae TaxID=2819979 RepID=A0ABX8GH47_9CELL|nr:protein phosphatase 2C domain-containing protein [Cellulomonas dongxiuzhuiae]MBO3094250.1 serine/threonine-protein phosphatase [Cellulomonas dongxiuzhuiae]QWC15300.1 protein phosphatase 2C domain-containing protein [Cellulomonas dongxiuzhuiae]